jgi:hypothetical protein
MGHGARSGLLLLGLNFKPRPSALCPLPYALSPLPSALCPMLSALCSLSSVLFLLFFFPHSAFPIPNSNTSVLFLLFSFRIPNSQFRIPNSNTSALFLLFFFPHSAFLIPNSNTFALCARHYLDSDSGRRGVPDYRSPDKAPAPAGSWPECRCTFPDTSIPDRFPRQCSNPGRRSSRIVRQ